jgi:cytochrome P450
MSTQSILDFDPTSTDFYARDDYHDVLRALRDEAPVHEVEPGLVTIARYDDIREISRSPLRFKSGGGALVHDPIREGTYRSGAPLSILFVDPPDHVEHRKLVNREFTPRAVGGMETRIRELARATFDRVAERASEAIDVVDELTAPFPLLVIAELLGIPDGDRGDFRRWSDATIESTDRPPGENLQAILEMREFLLAHIAAKHDEPGDDLVSVLTQRELMGRPLDDDDLFAWLLTLLVAGNETTRTLLSGAIVALDRHPDQRALLAADPDLIPNAVEECLRWVTPIQTFCRTVVADTEVGGTTVREGDYLIMLYASGNRDDRAYGPTADAFDITREVNPAHLAFGFGEHLCLGAALARLEARVFFEELVARYPSFEVVGPAARVPSTLVAGIHSVPVVLAP